MKASIEGSLRLPKGRSVFLLRNPNELETDIVYQIKLQGEIPAKILKLEIRKGKKERQNLWFKPIENSDLTWTFNFISKQEISFFKFVVISPDREVLIRSIEVTPLIPYEEYDMNNLVINGGFELYHTCPLSFRNGRMEYCYGWNSPCYISPNENSSDHEIHTDGMSVFDKQAVRLLKAFGSPNYLNNCNYEISQIKDSLQFSGEGSFSFSTIAIVSDTAQRKCEYIQGELKTELMKDSSYIVSLALKKDESSGVKANSLGVKFYTDCFSKENLKMKWEKADFSIDYHGNQWKIFSFEYTAKGGERYIVIGDYDVEGFKFSVNPKKNQDSYYFIDDVSVKKVER